MDTLVLEDAPFIDDLLPLTATRHVLDIRMGILTLREKWQYLLRLSGINLITPDDPATNAGAVSAPLKLPANILPTRALIGGGKWEEARQIRYPWDIFRYNGEALTEDFALVTNGRQSQPIPSFVQTIAGDAIFIEEGARIGPCILNASTGPIYIGRHAEIMEGSLIRGPFALCEEAVVKMGTKIYGATTVGPHCTVGGEIKNSVLFGYSNKGHDGYLGDAVIGEWCNLGAGVSNSNLKNNADNVRVWHPATGQYLAAGTKCGLLMGDYSRAAINTAFNTGTVVGVCANVFGTGLTPGYIPDFSWGYPNGKKYEWEKVLRDIANWKKLKNQSLSDAEILYLKNIFKQS